MVTRHAPFGIFVDVGDPRLPGVVLLPEFADETQHGMPAFPAIASQLTCVLLGLSRMQPDGRLQPRLTLRPSRLRAAACAGRVEALPPEHRFAFLRKLMADGDVALTEAAAWRARLLPEQDRLPLLLEALAHPSIEVKIRAVYQVGDLPTRDRSIFLQEVLRQDNPAVAEAAVWQAGTLPLPARTAFLDLASRHSLPNVADRARWYVRFREKESPVV